MIERDDMELKRGLDALPREIEPPVDAWPGIRARLSRRVGEQASGRQKGARLRAYPPTRLLRIAALLTILAVSSGALLLTRRGAATWRVAEADGTTSTLAAGDSFSTGARGVRLTVGHIGHLDVGAGTSVRLVEARVSSQRMALTRGRIEAVISAPPRLFVVETPSGTAVDLGCAYTLEVDSLGNSSIAVTAGWVSFEDGSVRSLIPAGMHTVARKGRGVGTPLMGDAPDSLRLGVVAFDSASTDDAALGMVLRHARTRDAVTLWHLVQKAQGERRERIVTKLVAMVPPPDGVSRDAIARAEPHALELYWTRLPGTLPIVPSWQQALWKLWLKVGG